MSVLVGQSFCGIAILVAAFDPDASLTLAESCITARGACGTSTTLKGCILSPDQLVWVGSLASWVRATVECAVTATGGRSVVNTPAASMEDAVTQLLYSTEIPF
jgi:hypothetical protein